MKTLVRQDKADQSVIFRILYRFGPPPHNGGVNLGAPNHDGSINASYRGVPLRDLVLPKHGVEYGESYEEALKMMADLDANIGNRGE